VVPESNMPGYPWLAETKLVPEDVIPKMKALARLGVPYSAQEIREAPDALRDKTEQDALIAYLQELGVLIKTRN
jgi:cytochrome c oxidase cbb3-type subunit 2